MEVSRNTQAIGQRLVRTGGTRTLSSLLGAMLMLYIGGGRKIESKFDVHPDHTPLRNPQVSVHIILRLGLSILYIGVLSFQICNCE